MQPTVRLLKRGPKAAPITYSQGFPSPQPAQRHPRIQRAHPVQVKLAELVGWLGLLTLLGACGESPLDRYPLAGKSDTATTNGEIQTQPQAVVGGNISDAFAATGALRTTTDGGTSLCTATLVAPDMILTAAHCVEDANNNTRFLMGMDISKPTLERRVTATTQHPDYRVTNNGAVYDVAVGWLDSAVSEITAVQVAFTDINSLLGQRALLVGYGADGIVNGGSVGSGVRRGAEVLIEDLSMTHWESRFDTTDAVVCRGDSGGPAFTMVDGILQQVGITSLGDTRCEVLGLYSRLDLVEDWLRSQGLRETAGFVSCNQDNVCNGACQADQDCASYLCPRGTCTPASNGCTPTDVTYADNACHYIDNVGQTCATMNLVDVQYEASSGLCTYRDALGVSCIQLEPTCDRSGECICPS